MNKFGILITFAPTLPLKEQSLSGLIPFLLSGMAQEDNTTIVIATPAWYRNKLLEFLNNENIDAEKIQIITTSGHPIYYESIIFLANLPIRIFPANLFSPRP